VDRNLRKGLSGGGLSQIAPMSEDADRLTSPDPAGTLASARCGRSHE
jgi:hypothetical protein